MSYSCGKILFYSVEFIFYNSYYLFYIQIHQFPFRFPSYYFVAYNIPSISQKQMQPVNCKICVQFFLFTKQISVYIYNQYSMTNSFDLDSNLLFQQIGDICSQLNSSQNDHIFTQQTLQSTPTTSQGQNLSSLKIKNRENVIKDTNPNLLKNLVVTLRSWVVIKEPNFSFIQTEIWRYFKQSKKINKNLLWSIYGNISDDPQLYRTIQEHIPGLLDVSIEQYQKIQNILKIETVQQLKKADINYILKYRRVKNREQFSRYFHSFVKKLENGQSYSKKLK